MSIALCAMEPPVHPRSDAAPPISRYARKPRFRYSDLHDRWRSAFREGHIREMRELGAEHSARHGLTASRGGEA